MSDLQSELRRLIPPMLEAASLYWIQPEYDCPGDTPELCGYNCALCGGGGDTEETIEHASGCIVPDAMALPRILAALAAPAVKPLVWTELSGNVFHAPTPFGFYVISGNSWWFAGERPQTAESLEAAQSAAWAHWSERIGGALTKGSDDE